MDMATKQCTKCKEVKSVEEFNKSKRNKDGLQSYCKECQKNYYSKKPYIDIKPCETCGKEFITYSEKTRFCSRKCYRYEKKCVNCGETFVKGNSQWKYCSEKCKNEFFIKLNEKKCLKCGIVKKIDEFYKDSANPTGRVTSCKECQTEAQRKRNREKKLKKYMESIGYEEPDRNIPSDIDLEQDENMFSL